MSCPEGIQIQNTDSAKDEQNINHKKKNKLHTEDTGNVDLSSFRNPKNWKKSITSFFRNQVRSTKSNDGDNPSAKENKFEEKELSAEQKWQSLGKVFRRQSFVDRKQKPPSQREETSSPNKRLAVRKVLSSYFGKSKCPNENISSPNDASD